jgi:hypothetical protein
MFKFLILRKSKTLIWNSKFPSWIKSVSSAQIFKFCFPILFYLSTQTLWWPISLFPLFLFLSMASTQRRATQPSPPPPRRLLSLALCRVSPPVLGTTAVSTRLWPPALMPERHLHFAYHNGTRPFGHGSSFPLLKTGVLNAMKFHFTTGGHLPSPPLPPRPYKRHRGLAQPPPRSFPLSSSWLPALASL